METWREMAAPPAVLRVAPSATGERVPGEGVRGPELLLCGSCCRGAVAPGASAAAAERGDPTLPPTGRLRLPVRPSAAISPALAQACGAWSSRRCRRARINLHQASLSASLSHTTAERHSTKATRWVPSSDATCVIGRARSGRMPPRLLLLYGRNRSDSGQGVSTGVAAGKPVSTTAEVEAPETVTPSLFPAAPLSTVPASLPVPGGAPSI